VLLSPCSQTGVLNLTVGRTSTTPPPVELCETETGVAVIHTARLTAGTALSMSSLDDRGVSPLNSNGALVKLTIPLGEPNSQSALGNNNLPFIPTGFPLCTANLEAMSVICNGLAPAARYTFTRRRRHAVQHARADFSGVARITGMAITGGDTITLTNSSRRSLTTLHVAHLRVRINGDQTVVSGGTCEPGDYYGKPITTPPVTSLVGVGGATFSGTICPPGGNAGGLSSSDIEQTDDLSGGLTRTVVPDLESISPNSGATLYGPFVAQAQPFVYGTNGAYLTARATVSLTVTRLHSRRRVVFVRNVAVGRGARVRALPAGSYAATWVLSDVNGDTRTVHTRFVEA
jgi:hypothetical protein